MEITKVDIKEHINTDFKTYSMYVIQSRGIPNFYDSFTPVQRLILQMAPDKFQATVALVGQVMATGLYHHGDCLDYDTEINLADGSKLKIGEWCDLYPDMSLFVKCVDDDNIETISIGHSPRIGQVTDEVYEIEFEDGSIEICTGNHPFKIGNDWVETKNLKKNDDVLNI